jgi:hypothetical protein
MRFTDCRLRIIHIELTRFQRIGRAADACGAPGRTMAHVTNRRIALRVNALASPRAASREQRNFVLGFVRRSARDNGPSLHFDQRSSRYLDGTKRSTITHDSWASTPKEFP